ncbi:MAG: alpha-2-macroglobulin [Bacteroidaceae bacterium]|nr:alpha-2-macroglobulin [Bacteroidaceae bacterium]
MKRFRHIIILFAGVFMLLSCKGGKDASLMPSTEFATYISAFTGGIVTDDSSIRIDLVDAIPEESRVTDGLFSFSPSIKGTVLWTSPSSVSFIPDQDALKAGKTYKATFNLDKVKNIAEKSMRQFPFGFIVKEALYSESGNHSYQEEEQGDGFRVISAIHSTGNSPYIELNFSAEPANITKKGMVEMKGVSRFYIEPQGKTILIHYEDGQSEVSVKVAESVKDADGNKLGKDYIRTFATDDAVPAVSLDVTGSILPDNDNLILPFKAVNLSAVEVSIVKIYANNVLMYLQDNDLGGEESLRRAGKLVYHSDIPLDRSKDLHKWNNFSLDLSGLFNKEPGAIYKIRLSFRQDQSLYGGREPGPAMLSTQFGKPTAEDDAVWDVASPWYWENYYDWSEYDYDDTDDPAKPSFYMESYRFPSIVMLASDLGLMAKYSDGNSLWVAASDLKSAKPASSVQISVYDFQLQQIAQARTNSEGLTEISVSRRPFVIVGTKGNSVTYLKVNDGNEKSLSRFDVGGKVISEGLKSFIYGERGVWRPGDTLHISMILHSKEGKLPDSHPATIEVYTPEGQFHSRIVRQGIGGMYYFDIATRPDDPTGFWNAYIKVGGSSFHKTLHIESIKPNRLKINAEYGSDALEAGSTRRLSLSSSWLAGAPASGLKAKAVMTLKRSSSSFPGFEDYRFTSPSSEFSSSETELFSTTLNQEGKSDVVFKLPSASDAPGMLNAFIVTSVQEAGGDESFTTATIPFSPYSAYVGIKVPGGDYLETDKPQNIYFAVVNAKGKRVTGHKIEYRIFKTGWNWWWDNDPYDMDSYVTGSSVEKIAEGSMTSGSNDVQCSFQVNYPDWGRYMVIAKDLTSGHVSAQSFMVDWPDYRGRANRQDPENLTMLTFSTDKSSYDLGDKATLYIPAAPGGQALVSIENSTGVISSKWMATGDADRAYTFDITEEMAPNFYIHVTLLQPHGNVANDLPIRLYGVKRLTVENPESHLAPQISMPDVLHPEEEFTVTVSEKSGKPMTYTLAIVDEGLLDLTAFKTPDPWKAMNEVEALGVRTWDMYDQVIGAFSGKFSNIASIGGDQDNVVSARKDNRFNPVVCFLPPQKLAKGGKESHKIKLPMYVGSVRVMLVACNEKAFGDTDKTVPVTAPLMVVPTLPRKLSPGEEIQLPVNVFAMEDDVKSAEVSISVNGPVLVLGGNNIKVQFPQKGDQLVRFALKADGEGTATIEVKASGSGHSASEKVVLPIVNPNPARTIVTWNEIPAGRSVQHNAHGDRNYVQLSTFPAFDALKYFTQMKTYPYNCTEQLASRGIALLNLMPMIDKSETEGSEKVIGSIIQQLYSRQNSDGGFSYWGNSSSDTWVSSMAGLFLVQAANAGYSVDAAVVQAWKRYQQKLSNAYRIAGSSILSHLDEAYRLYTLAVAGSSSSSAMNRLKEDGEIGYRASWMLASAYAVSGKIQVAKEIIATLGRNFEEYNPNNVTYGSSMRDRMIALEALALTDNMREAVPLATEAAKTNYLSTQETAFAAVAFSRLRAKTGDSPIDAIVGGEQVSAKSSTVVTLDGEVSVKNNSSSPLYASFVDVVRDPAGTAVPASSNGIGLSVSYSDSQGRPIQTGSIKQGEVFTATVKVTNTSSLNDYDNLALSMTIPSGWEIQNERMTGAYDDSQSYDHKDIRDDRCDWFFSLPSENVRTFTLKLRAAYEGKFSLPPVSCSAMYQPEISASTASSATQVVR